MKTKITAYFFLFTLIMVGQSLFAQGARVQVIHNAADAAAATVDVWLNDQPLLPGLEYKKASPYIDAPAGAAFDVSITAPGSADTVGAIFKKSFTLEDGGTYVVVASGGLGETGDKAFDLRAFGGMEQAETSGNVSVKVFHGAYDAPMVDVYEASVPVGVIVDDISFGEDQGYLDLPSADFSLQVRTNENTVVQEYTAPLSAFSNKALTVLATGFLDPSSAAGTEPFGLIAVDPQGNVVALPMQAITPARLQVIHNSAATAAAMVDVWVNDSKLLPDFKFRTASPFVDAPAGAEFNVGIAGAGSASASEAIFNQKFILESGKKYIVVANGNVGAESYQPAAPFMLSVIADAREMAMEGDKVDVVVMHGSTDAPKVQVNELTIPVDGLVPGAAYGESTDYLSLGTEDYILELVDFTTKASIVKYSAPLKTLELEGNSLTLVASGYLNPSNNNGGEAFGLYAALASGGALVELPVIVDPMARVQVIHNAADAAAATVDVWLNDQPLLPGLEFKKASPYIDAPAGAAFDVSITAPGSADTVGAIFKKSFTLEDGGTYVVVASGGLGETGDKAFDLRAFGGMEQAETSGNVSVKVFHGAYDAPMVDVYEASVPVGVIVDDISFGEDQGYLDLPSADFSLQVRTNENIVVQEYTAPLSAFSNKALTVLATGFLDPSSAAGTEPFGLIAVDPQGNVVALPMQAITPARLQVIHNSAATAAAMVDVWVNDTKLLPDFKFRTASPFVDAPAGAEFNVGIAGAGSASASEAIFNQKFILESGKKYIVVANGNVGAESYQPAAPFMLSVIADAREMAMEGDKVDVVVMHGSTDAPKVKVNELTIPVDGLIPGFSYGESEGYLSLAEENYALELEDFISGNSLVSYSAPLKDLALEGSAITVIASGYLSPEQNNNGASFGLWVATAAGGDMLELPLFTTAVNKIEKLESTVYPNPSDGQLFIKLDDQNNSPINYQVINLAGKVEMAGSISGTSNVALNVEALSQGMYILKIQNEDRQNEMIFMRR